MRRYKIKFEDYDGKVHFLTVTAMSRDHARSMVFGAKEIYYITEVVSGMNGSTLTFDG